MEDFMQELKEQRIWMLWRFENRKGKRTKVPKSALDGGPSGSDESWGHTWVTYDEAVSAREAHGMDGVGFKISDGYFFLDVDHREMDDPLVQKLLTRFDSYAERSVSGGGIHIYGRCDATRIPTSTDANGKVKLDAVSALPGIKKRNRRSIPCINLLFQIWCRWPDSNGYGLAAKGF